MEVAGDLLGADLADLHHKCPLSDAISNNVTFDPFPFRRVNDRLLGTRSHFLGPFREVSRRVPEI